MQYLVGSSEHSLSLPSVYIFRWSYTNENINYFDHILPKSYLQNFQILLIFSAK